MKNYVTIAANIFMMTRTLTTLNFIPGQFTERQKLQPKEL